MNVSFNAHISNDTAFIYSHPKRHNGAVSFKAAVPEFPSEIASKYIMQPSKEKTIAILGSSRSTDSITGYIKVCYELVKKLVKDGKNIVTGCGKFGIMGAAYLAAKEFSEKNEQGKPMQNLVILKLPLYKDEDLENCVILTAANSEAERTEKFTEVADTIVIFPGSVTTLQEAATLIAKNNYREDKKKIVLIGKNFFKGLIEQYNNLYKTGLIKCKPNELFTII